jgi:hypothetical protein
MCDTGVSDFELAENYFGATRESASCLMLLFTVRVTFRIVSCARLDNGGGPCRIVCPMCLFSQMYSFAFYSSGVHLQTRALLPPFGPIATRPSPLRTVSPSDVACCLCTAVILMSLI